MDYRNCVYVVLCFGFQSVCVHTDVQWFFENPTHPYYQLIHVIAIVLHVPATFLLTLGLWFYFKNNSKRSNKIIEYLSDANYWIYISFLPVAMLLHILLLPLDLSIFLKFLITYAGALACSLLTYEYLVRYTFVGATMNSRLYRK